MRKQYFLSVIAFLLFFIQGYAWNVTVSPSGLTTVTAPGNSTSWIYDYGSVGHTAGNGFVSERTFYGSATLRINPFVKYDFYVKGYDMWGTASQWYGPYSINSCTANAKTVGYSFNFDTPMVDDCWRGYLNIANTNTETVFQYNYENHGTGTGQSVNLAAGFFANYKAMLVSPKISDLSVNRKVSFWVKNYSGSNMQVGTIASPYDPTTFHQLANIPAFEAGTVTYEWQKITVYLNNYNGTDQYIMIRFQGNYQQTDNIYIDDFSYEEANNCYDVSNVTVNPTGEHTALLDFTSAIGQSNWEVSLKNVLSQETTVFPITSHPYTISNLTGNTNYEVKVRAVCDSNQLSNWSAVIPFSTQCQQLTAPYVTSFYDASVLDPCWSIYVTPKGFVKVFTNIINGSSSILEPRTGSKLVQIGIDNGQDSDEAYLITPYLADLDNNKRIKIHAISRSFYQNEASLVVGTMTNPADPTTFHPLQTFGPNDMNRLVFSGMNNNWKEFTVYLNNYNSANTDHYIALKVSGNNHSSDTFYLDDFTYENIPACAEPMYPKSVKTTYNTANLSWTDYQNSTASEWQIEYGLNGFTPGTGTIATANSNPFIVQNIPADDSQYDFYVRSKCGNDYSAWSVKGTFKTKCIGVTVGYTDDFEDDAVGVINSCWTGLKPYFNDDYWDIYPFVTIASSASPNFSPVHSGTKSARHINYTDSPDLLATDKAILITPRLIGFNNFKNISFWMYPVESAYASPGDIVIGTMSDPDDYTTFHPFYTIIDAATHENQWKKYTIDFSSYTGTDQFVGIRQKYENDNQVIYIDDFEYNAFTCTTPTALNAAQSGNDSVTLSWNSNNSNPPETWTIEYGPKGFVAGTGTTLVVNSNPYELSGLDLYARYEFRVKNNCAVDNGEYSLKYPFKLSCSITAPFVENFDQYDISLLSDPADFCWTIPASLVAHLSEYCYEGMNSCNNALQLLYSSFPGEEGYGSAVSPFLQDFDASKSLKFYVNLYDTRAPEVNSYDGSDLVVGTVSNPEDFSTFVPYQVIDLGNIPFAGQDFVVDFANYTGTAKHIAFLHETGDFGNIFIDDVRYFTTNTCTAPINITINNINNNSADIHWEAANGANNYTIEYGPRGFTPGTGTVATTTATTFQLGNLTDSTEYDFYIKSICSNDNSSLIGPRPFFTTCPALTLPWIENFDTLPAYGVNELPACFRAFNGNIKSYNENETLYRIDFDNVITGVGDTHFLINRDNFESSMFLPMFSLQAGTTYNFTMMARKGYQYAETLINIHTGRGNSFSAMTIHLDTFGYLEEYSYKPYQFNFTPLVSGDYSFYMSFRTGGGAMTILDQFKLTEGYRESISSSNTSFDFQGAISNQMVVEATAGCTAGITTDPDNANNSVLKMAGHTGEHWTESNNNWLSNEENVTKINMKVNAANMQQLYMAFDLKQTGQTTGSSAFRVIVNGQPVGDVIYAEPMKTAAYNRHIVNLSAFTGSDIRISLQHLGKSAAGNGDTAFVDNISFSNTLNSETFAKSSVMVYPNPAHDYVTVSAPSAITKIVVNNINGQQLLVLKPNVSDSKIDLSAFSNGIYFLNVTTEKGTAIFKTIKN